VCMQVIMCVCNTGTVIIYRYSDHVCMQYWYSDTGTVIMCVCK